ncbi:TPA: hypothetical protein ACF311_004330 [Vibrio parahaemolyticus]|uniref:hypothetical protein n=2 Tax=Vibrio parahaemolyticus TaxID=670 RepID=UPI00111F3FF2|nr:hypothetical protein [Vibrio parahaemolyticus]MDZ5120790.1 hypothetical protein [Vibrio parahaemolyticus]TOG38873.1 hypothetical protein CGJ02_22740 [Vibrio parahaemolyticus]HBN6205655.1 hypothetical protein [Vibrio parahaemolyticus]HCH1122040.1 hypothetical protein [Vibrio parahaemolyticus]HCH4062448.1 hypothetical protein [Vibrio parahaemolyticus]
MQYALIEVNPNYHALVDANELYSLTEEGRGNIEMSPHDDDYEATLERQVVYGVYKPQPHFDFPRSEVKRHIKECVDHWLINLQKNKGTHIAIEDIEIFDATIMRNCGHCPKPHVSADMAFAALVKVPKAFDFEHGQNQAKTAFLKWADIDLETTLINRKGLFAFVAPERRFKKAPTSDNWRTFIDTKRAVTYAQRLR